MGTPSLPGTQDLHNPRLRPRHSEIPTPETDLSCYTQERVLAAKSIVEERLYSKTRKPSPFLYKLLCVYLKACDSILKADLSRKDLFEARSELRKYEKEMANQSWSREAPSDAAQKVRDQLLDARRLQYFRQYGDYNQRLAHKLRDVTRSKNLEGWQHVAGQHQWSDIAMRLEIESKEWEKHGSRNVNSVRTTHAVWLGAHALGIDYDRLIAAIRMHGERNQAFHNPINTMLVNGSFPEIAKTINQDLNDLPAVMPPELNKEEEYTRTTLLELRDDWFTVNISDNLDGTVDPPYLWIPKESLLAEYRAAQRPDRKNARELHVEKTAEKAAKLLRAEDEKEALLLQLGTSAGRDETLQPLAPILAAVAKREASMELASPDRKRVWRAIHDRVENAVARHTESLSERRVANRLISAYSEKFGDEPPPASSAPSSSPPPMKKSPPSSSPICFPPDFE